MLRQADTNTIPIKHTKA